MLRWCHGGGHLKLVSLHQLTAVYGIVNSQSHHYSDLNEHGNCPKLTPDSQGGIRVTRKSYRGQVFGRMGAWLLPDGEVMAASYVAVFLSFARKKFWRHWVERVIRHDSTVKVGMLQISGDWRGSRLDRYCTQETPVGILGQVESTFVTQERADMIRPLALESCSLCTCIYVVEDNVPRRALYEGCFVIEELVDMCSSFRF